MKQEIKENLEAHALAGVGLVKGIYEEFIKPNKEAVAVSAGVIATGVALGYLLKD